MQLGRNLRITRLHSISERWRKLNEALRSRGFDMGSIGESPDLLVKGVLMVQDGKETNVIFYIDKFGHPYAYTQTAMEAAVTSKARLVAFSEVADWMAPGDFAKLDAYLVTVRGKVIMYAGPLSTFLEGS